MKKIVCILLVLCCLLSSYNLTAFADNKITCIHCNKKIPKDSNYCCYCGLAINIEEKMSSEVDWYDIKSYGHDDIKRVFGDEIHIYKNPYGGATFLLFNNVDSFNLQGKLCIEIFANQESKVMDAYWMFEQGSLTTSDYEKIVQQVINQCDKEFGEHRREDIAFIWTPLSGGCYALLTGRGYFIFATTDEALPYGFRMLGELPNE